MLNVIQLGERAKKIVEDPAYTKAMAELQTEIFNEFRHTNMFQKRKREELHKMLRCADIFQAKLARMINSSEVEKTKQIKTKAKRILRG